MNPRLAQMFRSVRDYLSGLSFRTGAIVAAACVVFYVLSFAQMLLPISVTVKGVLWVVLFGLAKTAQYTALLIVGRAGVQKMRGWFFRKRSQRSGE